MPPKKRPFALGKRGGKGKKKGKKGKKKGKKGKKIKWGKMKKFNLDLFGILTFTRIYGDPFLQFMYAGGKDKKKKGRAAKVQATKRGKKGKKQAQEAPKLQMFPLAQGKPIARKGKPPQILKEVIYPSTNVGYVETSAKLPIPLMRSGSVRDVLCGPSFPLPPRPNPHGGIYGDPNCPLCKAAGGLSTHPFGLYQKKMRKLLNTEFEKAKYIINYMILHATDSVKFYEKQIQDLIDEFQPEMDALDDSEWDEHFEFFKLNKQWRDARKELAALKKELKKLRENRDDEIRKGVADKLREMEEAEANLRDLERQLREAMALLEDWRQNAEQKLADPAAEIARRLALLEHIRDSVLVERDNLRKLLAWETETAMEQTIREMERIIAEDVNEVLSWMHPTWFRAFLENRKIQQEESQLNHENNLLELEIATLKHQCKQLEDKKDELHRTRTFGIRVPNLKLISDVQLRSRGRIQLHEYPTTELLHE